MKRCTVCGATSREGARFCTSCGARLEESGSTPVEATAVQPAVTPPVTTSSETPTPDTADQPPAPEGGRDLESGWPDGPSASTSDATDTHDAPRDATSDVEVPDARDASAPEWPGMNVTDTGDTGDTADDANSAERRDDRDGDDVMAVFTTQDHDEAPADPDTAAAETRDAEDEHDIPADPPHGPSDWEGWSQPSSGSNLDTLAGDTGRDARDDRDESDAAEAQVVRSPAPRSFATDAYQDPGRTQATDRDSQFGGNTRWASSPGDVDDASNSAGDTDAHALLDQLRVRIDRLSDPASLADRGVDPDELADQLDRWRRTVPDTDTLLDAVKAARRSPRDIDALARLGDVAPDLEFVVRHYQSITEQSATWAESLRRSRDEA